MPVSRELRAAIERALKRGAPEENLRRAISLVGAGASLIVLPEMPDRPDEEHLIYDLVEGWCIAYLRPGDRWVTNIERLGEPVVAEDVIAAVQLGGIPVGDVMADIAAALAADGVLAPDIPDRAPLAESVSVANRLKADEDAIDLDTTPYAIFSVVHRLWHLPQSSGYTDQIESAGVFSRAAALKFIERRFDSASDITPRDIPIRLADARFIAKARRSEQRRIARAALQ